MTEKLPPLVLTKPTLFTQPITPETVRGKVFVFRSLEKNCIGVDWYGGALYHFQDEKEPDVVTNPGQQFVLFHVGTDPHQDDRHHFAIASYINGQVVDVENSPDPKPSNPGAKVQTIAPFVRNWETNDQVFYFEKTADNTHLIKTWYDSNLCWTGIGYGIKTGKPSGKKNQLWQLYEVRGVSLLPNIPHKPAEHDMAVPLVPKWDKARDPDPGDPVSAWAEVGSVLIPYFFVDPWDKYPQLGPEPKREPALNQDTAYYVLRRIQRWHHIASFPNPLPNDFTYQVEYTTGWSQEQSKSFTASVGIQIGVTAGAQLKVASVETSVTVTAELAWQWTQTNTIYSERKITYGYPIASGTIGHFWQIQEKFRLSKAVGGKELIINEWELPAENVVPTAVPLPPGYKPPAKT